MATENINELLEDTGIKDPESLSKEELAEIRDDIKETDKNYAETFANFNISDKDSLEILNVIKRYKNGEIFDLYEACPQPVKTIVDNMRASDNSPNKISKSNATKFILDMFIGDAKYGKIFDEYNQEIADAVDDMNREYNKIFKDSIDSIFKDIDKIRAENPDKADQLLRIKQSFEDSVTMDLQHQYVQSKSKNKLYKSLRRYEEECIYFNKKVNTTPVKVPDITELPAIIKRALPQYDEKEIKIFVISIIKSTNAMNVDKIEDLAYIYKLVSNIYNYKFVTKIYDDDDGSELFANISRVIDSIINHP